MAIHRRPPHPLRGPLILLVILVLLIGGIVVIANSAKPVPVKPIEVDVARGQQG